MKVRKIFKVFFALLVSAAVFFFLSAAYLNFEMKKTNEADNKTHSEPYEARPTNKGLLFKLENGENCLIYLDFEASCSYALFTRESGTRIGKYTVDYTVNADYILIAGIIDRLGGIELQKDGESQRYTGVQATELVSKSQNDYKLKSEILYRIFDKISKNGFSKDDFVYIIKNGGTDLLVPDCFYWEEFMPRLAQNFEVIS